MCGLTGFLLNKNSEINLKSTISEMTNTLNHRGPNNSDSWFSQKKE